jgi:predicted transcriptional regulator of viral defense system
MPRSAYTAVVDIAAEQQGYVTQEDARGAGIAATTLARMAERGTLVRTSHGVYRVPLIPAGPLDQYREATLWPRGVRGVLSNETALGLYELSDVNPAKIHITVPRAHRPQRATPPCTSSTAPTCATTRSARTRASRSSRRSGRSSMATLPGSGRP